MAPTHTRGIETGEATYNAPPQLPPLRVFRVLRFSRILNLPEDLTIQAHIIDFGDGEIVTFSVIRYGLMSASGESGLGSYVIRAFSSWDDIEEIAVPVGGIN